MSWSDNLSKRLVQSPNIMLRYGVLVAYLQGVDAQRPAEEPRSSNLLLESFVALELITQASRSECRSIPYHYLLWTGREIDILLEDRAVRLVGVEVKAAATVTNRDFRMLKASWNSSARVFGLVPHCIPVPSVPPSPQISTPFAYKLFGKVRKAPLPSLDFPPGTPSLLCSIVVTETYVLVSEVGTFALPRRNATCAELSSAFLYLQSS